MIDGKVLIVYAEPGKDARSRYVLPTLATFQSLVEGPVMSVPNYPQPGMHVYLNMQGTERKMPPNRGAAGVIVVSNVDPNGAEIGLTEAQAAAAVVFLNRDY